MTSTFAIDVIQTLQKHEIEDFRIFLESPYCAKDFNGEAVKPFFETLNKAIQIGSIETLEKKELYHQLFPGKPFIESKLDKLMSDLKRLLERFLLNQKYFSTDNEVQHALDLATEMRLRGLGTRHQQILEKVRKHTTLPEQDSLNHLFVKYQLAQEEQEWHSRFNKVKSDLNIPVTIHQLDTYYFAHRTWMLNNLMFMRNATTLLGEDNGFTGKNWDIPKHFLHESAFLNICWEIHQLLIKGTSQIDDIRILLKTIQINESNLSPESLSAFYTSLRNFCVMSIDAGNIDLFPVLHEINLDNLGRGYFYIDGKISPNGYLSVTQTALNVGAISWLKVFIEQHKDKIIDETETQDFYRMNKALCLFGEKKFAEALDMIPFGSSYSFYHLMARRLELKIYYELRSDLLEHKIDAFKMFISRAGRKVFSQNLHELFSNFVNFVRQLHQSDGPKAQQRSQVLINRIKEKKSVAERLWLMEKASELGKKR